MRCAVLLLLATSVYTFEVPFFVPNFLKKHVSPSSTPRAEAKDDSPPPVPRIAVIGAGAGGSSAAFWISKAKSRFGLDVEVDVYDRNNYIGGRRSFNGSLLHFSYLSPQGPLSSTLTMIQLFQSWNLGHLYLFK
jgi:NADPH-dependent 2,4-dienoyl-CoA reductase/sulfur reductase-like enzyme